MTRIIITFLCFLLLLWIAYTLRYLKNSKWQTITVNGTERSYILKTPAHQSSEKKPLIIVLHAYNDNPRQIEFYSELSIAADKNNFLVMYPKGTNSDEKSELSWNADICCNPALENNSQDVAFISELIKHATENLNTDLEQIFITGFSNGAMMAQKFAVEKPETIAGVAVVGGAGGGTVNLDKENIILKPTQPVPALLIHSIVDLTVPYAGGMPVTEDVKFSPFSVLVKNWQTINAPSQTQTKIIEVTNIGHMWPGWILQRITQPFTEKVSATDEILKFFNLKHE